MHYVLWIYFAVIVGYAIYMTIHNKEIVTGDDAATEIVPWKRGFAAAATAFALILILSAFVNDEDTMGSANTRWPAWTWRDGPFPD